MKTYRTRENYHALKNAGVCVQCQQREPIPGMVECDPCLERGALLNRLNHARAILRGCCPRHRTRSLTPGYRQCAPCVLRDRERRRKTKEAT